VANERAFDIRVSFPLDSLQVLWTVGQGSFSVGPFRNLTVYSLGHPGCRVHILHIVPKGRFETFLISNPYASPHTLDFEIVCMISWATTAEQFSLPSSSRKLAFAHLTIIRL
jgi:hypothetical protein